MDDSKDLLRRVFDTESARGGPESSCDTHSSTATSSSPSPTTRFTEPKSLSLGRRVHPREQDQLLRLLHPDNPRKQPGSPEVDREPSLHEDRREPRPLGRHDEIAAEREVEARSDRGAVDLGDRRFLEAVQRHRRISDVADAVERMTLGGGGRKIGARAECPPGTGDDDDPVLRG